MGGEKAGRCVLKSRQRLFLLIFNWGILFLHQKAPMLQARLPPYEAEILGRLLLGDSKMCLSQAAAENILQLRFSELDRARMHNLAAKARAGELSVAEQHEVEAYSRISSLLGILKSKARRSLKNHDKNGKT